MKKNNENMYSCIYSCNCIYTVCAGIRSEGKTKTSLNFLTLTFNMGKEVKVILLYIRNTSCQF